MISNDYYTYPVVIETFFKVLHFVKKSKACSDQHHSLPTLTRQLQEHAHHGVPAGRKHAQQRFKSF